jgi:hypothetical protein
VEVVVEAACEGLEGDAPVAYRLRRAGPAGRRT